MLNLLIFSLVFVGLWIVTSENKQLISCFKSLVIYSFKTVRPSKTRQDFLGIHDFPTVACFFESILYGLHELWIIQYQRHLCVRIDCPKGSWRLTRFRCQWRKLFHLVVNACVGLQNLTSFQYVFIWLAILHHFPSLILPCQAVFKPMPPNKSQTSPPATVSPCCHRWTYRAPLYQNPPNVSSSSGEALLAIQKSWRKKTKTLFNNTFPLEKI